MPAVHLHITGVVQGVGFRPFVYRLAQQHAITGWVRNTSAGVDIHAEGMPADLEAFTAAITADPPPLARIHSLAVHEAAPEGHTAFTIYESAPVANAFQPISPDIALCPDCLRELRDPADRRYRYPFINCTNCGPRFTLIRDVPYDRPLTTMAGFTLCEACAAEYHDPADRRFHAQPVACPVCGPHVWLEIGGVETASHDEAIRAAVDLLRAGKIVAIKGLGGFHLACDATHPTAVAELRRRKGRAAKPFALMMNDVDAIRQYCNVSETEIRLLESTASPIVLLDRRQDGQPLASEIAPGQRSLGVMLPYTPLHVLLMDDLRGPLVMTSGNRSETPIVTGNDEAREQLSTIADAFLMHNRDIHIRTDDSVMRVFEGVDLPVRRSRGYAPYPVRLPFPLPPILAVGGELKNTFCVTRDNYAFMSHHIGDMENYETVQSFESGITHFERLFRIRPQAIGYDLHPGYRATHYARARAEAEPLPAIGVQHHHAHIAAVMAEHGIGVEGRVIGVCFDGTGYGTDGTIWGGEFLIAGYADFEHAAYLKPIRLPGGDAATRKPARIALSHLLAAGMPLGDDLLGDDLPPVQALGKLERRTVITQIERGLNAPYTSSMGRLFDAVAALIGVCQTVSYEGQAAIELESAAHQAPDERGAYAFAIEGATLDAAPVIRALVADWRAGLPVPILAARFHQAVAALICEVCVRLSAQTGISTIALSGGVFQNVTLLGQTLPLLRAAGLQPITHTLVPPNDGGLALGQAVIAGVRLERDRSGMA
ncbi:MAG: carbamoyltransferase HypF [Anaerolineae bacterium]